jgi:heme-degrading monooxygenase HmoA
MNRFVFTLVAASVSALLSIQSPPAAAGGDASVVLVNPFEVKPGREQECLAMWKRAAEFLRAQPGFRSTALHESIGPDARFRYVNVAVWESATAFRNAVSEPAFRSLAATDACVGSPALYGVAITGAALHE